MKRTILGVLPILFACSPAYSQSPAGHPTFEVASIKPAPPPEGGRRMGTTGGPGSRDPGRFTTENLSLSMLVSQAFDLKRYQLSAPGWMESERFNIVAKVPEGATREEFRLMLQNLLVERFKLKFHREKKEMPIYELVVAKDGPKFKESVPAPPPVEGAAPPGPPDWVLRGQPPPMGKDGFPDLPAGRAGMMMMNGRARWNVVNQSMEQIAASLSNQVGRPVTDATGLKAKYDFSIYWAMGGMAPMGPGGMPPPPPPPGMAAGSTPQASLPDDSGPTIFGAVQQQLGLKLEPKRGMVDIVVVDHMEKIPTEN